MDKAGILEQYYASWFPAWQKWYEIYCEIPYVACYWWEIQPCHETFLNNFFLYLNLWRVSRFLLSSFSLLLYISADIGYIPSCLKGKMLQNVYLKTSLFFPVFSTIVSYIASIPLPSIVFIFSMILENIKSISIPDNMNLFRLYWLVWLMTVEFRCAMILLWDV